MISNTRNFLNPGIYTVPEAARLSRVSVVLDDIVEHAAKAKSGSGFSIHMNGKIEQVYP
jgi:hypothetical protein